MGIFNFGSPKEKRTQLLFRDDGQFEFRKLEIEDTFLVERKDELIVKGWKHLFRNQFPFPGYKGIAGSDMVTLGYDRGFILDPYHIVTEVPKEKETGITLDGKFSKHLRWLVEVGNARRLKIIAKRPKNTLTDRITNYLGIALVCIVAIIAIQAMKGQVGGR